MRLFGPIVLGAPEYLSTPFPVAEVLWALDDASIQVRRSQDLGSFVCNHALYLLLHWAALHPAAAPGRIGFMHMPRDRMSAFQMGRALVDTLEVLIPEETD